MHNSSKEDILNYWAQSIVQNVVNGYNGIVMDFGKTGAAMTFTMNGATINFKCKVIITRSTNHIFQ